MHTTHTPGPWVEDDGNIFGADGRRFIASMGAYEGDEPDDAAAADEANANLICAAPDLLAALLYYRNECSGAEPSISVFHRMLDEAVAKATGESHA